MAGTSSSPYWGKKKKIRSLTHKIHKTIGAKYLHISKQDAGPSMKTWKRNHQKELCGLLWTCGPTHGCPPRVVLFQDEIKNNNRYIYHSPCCCYASIWNLGLAVTSQYVLGSTVATRVAQPGQGRGGSRSEKTELPTRPVLCGFPRAVTGSSVAPLQHPHDTRSFTLSIIIPPV